MRNIGTFAISLCLFGAATAHAQEGGQINAILGIGSNPASEKGQIGYAREQILKEAATALGARWTRRPKPRVD